MGGYKGARPLSELHSWPRGGRAYLGALAGEDWDVFGLPPGDGGPEGDGIHDRTPSVSEAETALIDTLNAIDVPVLFYLPKDAGAVWDCRLNTAAADAGTPARNLERVGAPTLAPTRNGDGIGEIAFSDGNGYHAVGGTPFPAGTGLSLLIDHDGRVSRTSEIASNSTVTGINRKTRLRFRGASRYIFLAATKGARFAGGAIPSGTMRLSEWAIPPEADVPDVCVYENGTELPRFGTPNPGEIDVTGDTFVIGGWRRYGESLFTTTTIGFFAFAVGRPLSRRERLTLYEAVVAAR